MFKFISLKHKDNRKFMLHMFIDFRVHIGHMYGCHFP